MKADEYNTLYAEAKKLNAFGDILRCNASKLQDDTIETLGGLIFDISKNLMKNLREMYATDEVTERSETFVI
jgi:hypothetical protein